jgi:hypothetical protein
VNTITFLTQDGVGVRFLNFFVYDGPDSDPYVFCSPGVTHISEETCDFNGYWEVDAKSSNRPLLLNWKPTSTPSEGVTPETVQFSFSGSRLVAVQLTWQDATFGAETFNFSSGVAKATQQMQPGDSFNCDDFSVDGSKIVPSANGSTTDALLKISFFVTGFVTNSTFSGNPGKN